MTPTQLPEAALCLLLAAILDQLLGDPVYRWHPVRLAGQCIERVERFLRTLGFDGLIGGAILLFVLLLSGLSLVAGLTWLSGGLHPWLSLALLTALLYTCLGLRDLESHVSAVQQALEQSGLEAGRKAVARIVGRNVQVLDHAGVARAAAESLSENFVDAGLATLCYFSLGALCADFLGADAVLTGVLAALAHRLVNTADAMVGYRNARYERFGKVSARSDDLLGWLPARLSIAVLSLAAIPGPGRASDCWRIGWRDRLRHDSPNAGHAESALAGALGLCLGGPTQYAHGTTDKPWLGDGRKQVSIEDLRRALRLVRTATWLSVFCFVLLLLCLAPVAEEVPTFLRNTRFFEGLP